MNDSKIKKNRQLVFTAFLTALIIVLQALSYALATLGFKVAPSLVLVPVVIGGIILGRRAGTVLGLIFGIITFIGCITGIDVGGSILFAANPLLTFVVCICKGTLAGFVSAVIFHAVSSSGKHNRIASIIAAAACPVVNTGLFVLFMLIGFTDTLKSWASGTDVLSYILIGLIGINFVLEFLLNVILVPIISPALSKTRLANNI